MLRNTFEVGRETSRSINEATANDVTMPSMTASCHSQEATEMEAAASAQELQRLFEALACVNEERNSRSARPLNGGLKRMARKLIEEAAEVAFEALRARRHRMVRESADLLYHLVVLWRASGIEPVEVWHELQSRADTFGIAEKYPKSAVRQVPGNAPIR